MKRSDIIKECRKIVKCDRARISQPFNEMYLIIGFKKSTKGDPNSYFTDQDGKRRDFNYYDEKVIAHSDTAQGLIDSVKVYKHLTEITWEQYFKELTESKNS